MTNGANIPNIDFTVDKNNLYREEGITDHKVASIRRLVPIKVDGSEDPDREPVFYASTQLMTPEGPLPIQAALEAKTLEAAIEEFPDAMRKALTKTIDQIQRQQQQQEQEKQQEQSRIYVPGR
ncbi:MAG: cytoplasmic protein [Desulfosalsimonadaceae bacterium]